MQEVWARSISSQILAVFCEHALISSGEGDFIAERIGKTVLEPSQILEPTYWLLKTFFATYALLPYPF